MVFTKSKIKKFLSWSVRAGQDLVVILIGAGLISALWYVLFILRPFC